MIRIYKTLLFVLLTTGLYSQAVVLQRISELMPEGYSINGNAFLEELDNGELQLRLSDDFSTPAGPDVRIILNNSFSSSGGVEVINLSDIGHFSGALTVPVPAGVDIDDYDFILFFCVQFQQFWASGSWSDSAPPGGGFICLDSDVSTVSGQTNIDICPSDGSADIVSLANSLNLPTGTNYAYLLTDENEILQEVINGDEYNFEGSELTEQRIYGVHYDGNLSAMIGSDRSQTTASGCSVHSSSSEFIQITKNSCPPPFDCLASTTFSDGGTQVIDICPTDGSADVIFMANSINEEAGDHYAFLITNENDELIDVAFSSDYNFEGTSSTENRVYGIHFDGTLFPEFNSNRLLTTASECFTHSSGSEYITVTKNGCPPVFDCLTSSTSSENGQVVNICPTDGTDDEIIFTNNIDVEAGDHYAYLVTDENEVVAMMIADAQFNFEGSGLSNQRVYGIHFDGDLDVKIGEDRMETTASGCYEHSEGNVFLTITKTGCPPPPPVFECLTSLTATTDWATSADICPTDGEADIVELRNNLFVEPGEHYAYLITDSDEVVLEMTTDSMYNFEGSGLAEQRVYGIHFDGDLDVKIGEDRMETTASGCYEHSGGNLFLTINKTGCPPPPPPFECLASLTATTDWAVSADICPTDGEDDLIELRNNLFIAPGEHYAYLITDSDEVVLEMTTDSMYNFEGSGLAEQRVYGIHFDGDLDVKIGEDRMETTASGCFEHSGGNLFLTINKTECPPPPTFECLASLTATTDWAVSADICPTDGEADIIELRNNLFVQPGEHYAYLITDSDEVVLEMTTDSMYNFEGSGLAEQRVYGIHFDGDLDVKIGEDRLETTASGCYEHSGGNLFLTINKTECPPPPPFECLTSLTATTDWAVSTDICPTDGEDDLIELRNNLFIAPGEHYAYLITDTNEVVLEMTTDSMYNFEGSGFDEQRVYGIHFDGDLDVKIGEDRMETTASGCFEHSGGNLFLTVSKTLCNDAFECVESLTATHNWVTQVDICSTDGEDDNVFLQNNIFTPPGVHYAFLLTDASEVLLEVILDTVYNFEGATEQEYRIYGMSYSGELISAIGEDRENTTASECAIHSGEDLYITISTSASCVTATDDVNIDDVVNVFPNPSNGNINIDYVNPEMIQAAYLYNSSGNLIKKLNKETSINIEQSGMYTMVIHSELGQFIKRLVVLK